VRIQLVPAEASRYKVRMADNAPAISNPARFTLSQIDMPSTDSYRYYAESNPTHEFVKAWIGMEFVQTLIHRQVGKQVGALLISAIEPCKCLILFSQTRINNGDIVRGDVFVNRQFLEMFDDLRRLFPLA